MCVMSAFGLMALLGLAVLAITLERSEQLRRVA
jgi:hypothetical protein